MSSLLGEQDLYLFRAGSHSRFYRQMGCHDLLTDARYLWSGARNYIELDPARVPAHVFRVRRGVHNERDFDPQGA